jgi:hypothetical protein
MTRLEQLESIRATLKLQGWLDEDVDLGVHPLGPSYLDGFKTALLRTQAVLDVALGPETSGGIEPISGTVLMQVLQRLIEELATLEAGAESELLTRPLRRNSHGAKPKAVTLKILVGLFMRHCGKMYATPNAALAALAVALDSTKAPIEVRTLRGHWRWFEEVVSAGKRPFVWTDAHQAIVAFEEQQLAQVVKDQKRREYMFKRIGRAALEARPAKPREPRSGKHGVLSRRRSN